MKKINHNKIVLTLWIFFLLFSVTMQVQYLDIYANSYKANDYNKNIINNEEIKGSSSNNNYEILQAIMDQKCWEYQELGYYPQIYEPSLQATYYGLYILESLNRLDHINTTKLEDFIMSKYSENKHYFIDSYAYRYLDSDHLDLKPWNSVLEVNCFAILSLKILDRLELIDKQQFIDFTWSCYNPMTSGFIGQSFNPDLPSFFRLSTLDNTFFAIKTLDLLIDDWSAYTPMVSELTVFINSLQSHGINGGFLNDDNFTIDSLDVCEPNLISTYYALKSLETFGMLDTIRVPDLNENLAYLYHNDKFFDISTIPMINNESNVVASAIGLELSILSGLEGVNYQNVAEFVINNRNAFGSWDSSTNYDYHELIDTFQIIRSLRECGYICNLSSSEKDTIVNSLDNYEFNGLFSLMSEDYCSLTLLNSIVSSFHYFGRISNLRLQGIYDHLLATVIYISKWNAYEFAACWGIDPSYYSFRSVPIEYIGSTLHEYFNGTDSMRSQKWNFLALDTLSKCYKLDDLEFDLDLGLFVNETLRSQFLDPTFENYGGFIQAPSYTIFSNQRQNRGINLENTYYAIRTLELLADFLNLGNLTDLTFDKIALSNYIVKNIIENEAFLCYDPKFTQDKNIVLQYTYFMAYILNALGEKVNNIQKIQNFVLNSLDYSNLESIYYCYKLSEVLGLEIQFDHGKIQELITLLYDPENHEFYLDSTRKKVSQEAFAWICEMAKNSKMIIYPKFDAPLYLGTTCRLEITFENLVLDQLGSSGRVWFTSKEFGTIPLSYQPGDIYQTNFLIPFEPEYFPIIEGEIQIYDLGTCIGQAPIILQTEIEQDILNETIIDKNEIQFQVNISRFINGIPKPLNDSEVFIEVFSNDTIIEIIPMDTENFQEYTTYHANYDFDHHVQYKFNAVLLDDYYPQGMVLFSKYLDPSPITPLSLPPININGMVLAIIGISFSVFIPGLLVGVNTKLKKKKKQKTPKSKEDTINQQAPTDESILNEIKQNYFNN
jgi:hypothetical protein